MDCESVREAVSARLDGEDPGLPVDAVEAHLHACGGCLVWQERAHEVTRRSRLGGPVLDHDLTPRILAGARAAPDPGRRRPHLPWAQRAALLAVAALQLAITVPLLILGHDHDAGRHAAHELGSFDLALAIAFAVGSLRPALSAGLAWPCGIAALGLAATAVIDLAGGQTPGADEAQHLVALAGAALLFWQARTGRAGAGGPAPAMSPGRAGAAEKLPGWHPARSAGGGGHLPVYRPGAANRKEGAA
jgi:predicted anti-sigma-YlaC factor YlaD